MRFFDYKVLRAMGFSSEQRTLQLSAMEWNEMNTIFWFQEGVRPPRDCFSSTVSPDHARYTLDLTDAAANGMKQWSSYEAATGG